MFYNDFINVQSFVNYHSSQMYYLKTKLKNVLSKILQILNVYNNFQKIFLNDFCISLFFIVLIELCVKLIRQMLNAHLCRRRTRGHSTFNMVYNVCEHCQLASDPGPAMTGSTAWDKLGAELLLLSSTFAVLLLSCGEIIFPLKKSLSYLHSIDSFPARDSQALDIHHNEILLFDVTAWLETGALRQNKGSSSLNCPFVGRTIDRLCFLGWKKVIFYIVKFNSSSIGFKNTQLKSIT